MSQQGVELISRRVNREIRATLENQVNDSVIVAFRDSNMENNSGCRFVEQLYEPFPVFSQFLRKRRKHLRTFCLAIFCPGILYETMDDETLSFDSNFYIQTLFRPIILRD